MWIGHEPRRSEIQIAAHRETERSAQTIHRRIIRMASQEKFSKDELSNPVQACQGTDDEGAIKSKTKARKTWIRALNGIYIETA